MQIILTPTKHNLKNKICKTHCKSYSNQTSNDKTQQPGERILEIRSQNISDPAPKFSSKSAQYTFPFLSDTADPLLSHWPWRLIFRQHHCIFMSIWPIPLSLWRLIVSVVGAPRETRFWAELQKHFIGFYLSSYAMRESVSLRKMWHKCKKTNEKL